jgi:uncharacterized protein (TIGR02996 family)
MTDGAALLRAVLADPGDDAPRLVYADWLEENGQPERAEFIRVQCELARKRSPALRRRAALLLANHHDALAGPLAAPGFRFRFRRGFAIAFGHTGLIVADRAVTRSRVLFYRFYINGTWIADEVGPETDESLTKMALDGEFVVGPSKRATYTLDSLGHPALIQFCWQTRVFQGSFDGREFTLEIPDAKRKLLTACCKHLHIDGLDTFTET